VRINGVDDGAASRVPVIPEAGRCSERCEGSRVFDELEGQRTGWLEVRPTLFLGNAPEVIRRGKIDAKIKRDALNGFRGLMLPRCLRSVTHF